MGVEAAKLKEIKSWWEGEVENHGKDEFTLKNLGVPEDLSCLTRSVIPELGFVNNVKISNKRKGYFFKCPYVQYCFFLNLFNLNSLV